MNTCPLICCLIIIFSIFNFRCHASPFELFENIKIPPITVPTERLRFIEEKIMSTDENNYLLLAYLHAQEADVHDRYTDGNKMLNTARKGLAIINDAIESKSSRNNKEIYVISLLHYRKARAFYLLENYQKCLESIENSLYHASRLDKLDMVAYNSLLKAMVFASTENYEKALKMMSKSYNLAFDLNDMHFNKVLYGEMGNMYSLMKNYEQAIYNFEKAISLLDQNEGINENHLRYSLAAAYIEIKKYTKALENLKVVFQLSEQLGDTHSLIYAYNAKSDIYFDLQDWDKALEAALMAEKLSANLQDRNMLYYIYADAASIYTEIGSFPLAQQYLSKAREVFEEENIPLYIQLSWLHRSINLAVKMENYHVAFTFQRQYEQLKRKEMADLYNQASLELRKSLDVQDMKLKEQQLIAENAQQNLELTQTYTVLLSVAGAFIVSVFLVFWQWRSRNAISALAQKQQQLNAVKNRFFSNLTHEFRTAVTLSVGPIREILNRNNVTDPLDYKYLQVSLKNNLHMMKLLNQFLDIEKIESQNMPVKIIKMDLIIILKSCIDRFQLQLDAKSITIATNGFESSASLYFDPDHFEKIILNLLSNAEKYSPADSTIEVGLSTDDKYITISVTDQGQGIEEDEIPYVFDRFFQGKESSTLQQPGTGIGLALVKELLDLHSGQVNVTSQVGCGSSFSIKLRQGVEHYSNAVINNTGNHTAEGSLFDVEPASELYNADNSILSPDDHQRTVQNFKKILVVEDNQDMRLIIVNMLRPTYQVIEAQNGKVAFEQAVNELPDLIVSDVMMPVIDGLTLVNRLKATKQTAHIPVFLLTAKSGQQNIMEGLLEGANDYLSKPFFRDELLTRIANQLADVQRIANNVYRDFVHSRHQVADISVEFETEVDKFQNKFEELILDNLNDSAFNINDLSEELSMTPRTLNRKCHSIYGCSAKQLLKKWRLESAHQVLATKQTTISEVAYAFGFESLSSFSRAFKEYYDYPPSQTEKD